MCLVAGSTADFRRICTTRTQDSENWTLRVGDPRYPVSIFEANNSLPTQ